MNNIKVASKLERLEFENKLSRMNKTNLLESKIPISLNDNNHIRTFQGQDNSNSSKSKCKRDVVWEEKRIKKLNSDSNIKSIKNENKLNNFSNINNPNQNIRIGNSN